MGSEATYFRGGAWQKSPPLSPGARAALLEAYRAARAEADGSARFRAGDPELSELRCRYCGAHRARIQVSRLDGHAKCVVTAVFMRRVLALAETGTTLEAIGAVLGVSDQVLRAWCRAAMDGRDSERDRCRGKLGGLEALTLVLGGPEVAR